jgi:anti-sigma-K factor RskA
VSARDDDIRESAAAYALGALTPEEARDFEALLADSAEARAELAAFREVAALLPLAAGVPAPGPDLKARVLARATGRVKRQPAAGRRRGDWVLRWALAATALLAVGATALVAVLVRARGELAGRTRDAETRLAALEARLSGREALLNSLLDPANQLFHLTATGDGGPPVQLFWNRERQVAVLHASELDRPAPDRAWQLWLIPEGGAPVPSSVFRPEDDGHVLVQDIRLPDDGRKWVAFALTEEPAGGSPAPTSAPRYLASLPG